eukprot:gene15586-17159_t
MAFVAEYIRVRNLQMQQAAVQFFSNACNDREAWVFHRQHNKFDVYYNADLNTSKDLDPNYWTTHRVSRDTFDSICSVVHRFMEKDFVGGLVHPRNQFIVWPETEEQCEQTIKKFETLSPLPNVFDAIDGTHVHILAPEDSTVDFFDRKQRCSIGIQGVCDGTLKFISVSAGFPGSMHDSRILRNTRLYQDAMDGKILQAPLFKLSRSISLKPYLVGDAAYPINDWLIKPFAHSQNMPNAERLFNLSLSQARVSIERAFGIFKGRWRLLLGKVCLEPSYVADTVMACCVLHNICQECNEPAEEVTDPYSGNANENIAGSFCESGETIRDLLVDYICNLEDDSIL